MQGRFYVLFLDYIPSLIADRRVAMAMSDMQEGFLLISGADNCGCNCKGLILLWDVWCDEHIANAQ